MTLRAAQVETVSNRDKALIWLSKEMGLKCPKCNIGTLTDEELIKANKIILAAYNSAYKKR